MLLIATAITCAVGLPIVFMTFFYRLVEPLTVFVRNATGGYDAVPYKRDYRTISATEDMRISANSN